MTVQVRSHRAIATRAGVAAALAGAPGTGARHLGVRPRRRREVRRGDRRTAAVDVEVPIAAGVADVNELDLFEPGVHPISVQIRRDGALVASHDHAGRRRPTRRPGPRTVHVLRPGRRSTTPGRPRRRPSSRRPTSRSNGPLTVVATVDAPVTVAVPPTYLASTSGRTSDALGERALDGDDRLAGRCRSAARPVGRGRRRTRRRAGPWGVRRRTAAGARFAATPWLPQRRWIVDDNITTDGATALRNLGIPLLVVPYDQYLELRGNLGDFTDPTLMLSTTTLTDDSSMRVMVVDPINDSSSPTRPDRRSSGPSA